VTESAWQGFLIFWGGGGGGRGTVGCTVLYISGRAVGGGGLGGDTYLQVPCRAGWCSALAVVRSFSGRVRYGKVGRGTVGVTVVVLVVVGSVRWWREGGWGGGWICREWVG